MRRFQDGYNKDYYFFFQAEDGIRDGTVTGVQTCALPIYVPVGELAAAFEPLQRPFGAQCDQEPSVSQPRHRAGTGYAARSEERRVGKECRSRWSPYH